MKDDVIWGDVLRVRIAAAGMTQAGLSTKLKVSRARINELCSRDSPPKIETILRLAEALDCDAADLDGRIASRKHLA